MSGRSDQAFTPHDPRSLRSRLSEHLDWLQVKNFSERTVSNRAHNVGHFIDWCEERGVMRPSEVTRPVLERYQVFLFHYRKTNGDPLSFHSQHTRLSVVRSFFSWLARFNYVLYNPAADLEMPKVGKRLPQDVMTASEVEQVLALADINDPLGLRDRAILEILYSTGIRRQELINLHVTDIDRQRGTVMVRQGKGRKDRVVPIGERALAWSERYIYEVRPRFVVGHDEGVLFLTARGNPIRPNRLSELVGSYIAEADLGKRGACHLFRHTMATLLLENGVDIRFIQQMLGHALLSTTEVYTRVSIVQLKKVHAAAHPARLSRATSRPSSDADDSGQWSVVSGQHDDFFSSLAAEKSEELDEQG